MTGFRIKVRNIWECSSKAIETSREKMNQLKLEYIIHVKPITPFNSFFNLALKHLNHVKLLHWKRDRSKGTLFVCNRELSFATTFTFVNITYKQIPFWNFKRNYKHGQFVTLKTISSITSFLPSFLFFHQIISTMELTNWEWKHVPFHQS